MDDCEDGATSAADASHATLQLASKKRWSGNRCMAFGCSNTAQGSGFFIHEMPGKMPANAGERFTPFQKAWLDFIGKKRKFDSNDARGYKRINLCSGHFTEEDYVGTEVQMYKWGLRRNAPSLKKDAKPTVEMAKLPFPPSWFIPTALLASPLPMAMETSTLPMVTSSSSSTTSSSLAARSSTPTGPSTSATGKIPFILDEGEAGDDTGTNSTHPTKAKRRRLESKYIGKKDAEGIFAEYRIKADEEEARERGKDILDR